jgi:hypothetical protein
MTRQLRRALAVPFFAALILVVAACTASPGASTAPSQAAGSLPAASQPDGVSMAPADSTNPGTTPRDWCLNTVEEVSAAIGGAAVTATGADAPGVGGGCLYANADGKLVYAVSTVTSSGATQTFDAAKATQGVVTISGIGDGAVLMSAQGPLIVLKGSALLSLGLLPDSGVTDPTQFRAKNEELAKAAVGRL